MPRAKAKATPPVNGESTVSSSSGSNGHTAPDEKSLPVKLARNRKAAAAEVGTVMAEAVKTSATGRSRKKVPEKSLELLQEAIEQKTVVRGRGKKAALTTATETQQEINKVEIKPKGRSAKKVAEQQLEAPQVEANGVMELPAKATKATVKGRKKKEATPAPEVEPAQTLPKKRASKKSDAELTVVAETAETPTPTKATVKPKKEKSLTKAEASKKIEIKLTVSKPTTKRGRDKKLEPTDTETAGEEVAEVVQELAPSPKKKAKKSATTEKSKLLVADKQPKRKATKTEVELEEVEEEFEAVKATVKKPRAGRKRAAAAADEDVDEDEIDGAKPAKAKKAAPLNSTTTSYNKADFELPATGEETGKQRYNLKIASWNVAGLRAWLKKDGLKYLDYEEPDIFCMQEIKCTTDQLPDEAARIPGYHPYWLCMPGGHAGVAIYSKIMPINVEYGIGNAEFDATGRLITAEYEKFFLINVYVPNSGRKLVNLEPRMRWELLFQQYVQQLDARKPVIICGDMNVSHLEIDLANPKANVRNAGFTKEERDKMTELLALGYVDTYRHLYPERKGAYTFWTYMGNARARNVGWRLDYFLVSERLRQRVVENCMRVQCMGSDHCPIALFMKL